MRAVVSLVFWMLVFSFIVSMFGGSDVNKVMQSFSNSITRTIDSTVNSFNSNIDNILGNIKGSTGNMPGVGKMTEQFSK
ncbi:MAG: hypothetical protein IRD7MM_00030 [Candidatus Midichloria mitochondrii]